MIDPTIVEYIKTQLHAGSREEDISIALAKRGWSAVDIATNFEVARAPVDEPIVDSSDNPLAYEKLHPKEGSSMSGLLPGSNTLQYQRRTGTQKWLLYEPILGSVLALFVLVITYVLYVGVNAHVSGQMISDSFLFIVETFSTVNIDNVMPLAYFLPLPILLISVISVCRYIGKRIGTREEKPYLGFLYANALYFFIIAIVFAVVRIIMNAYYSTLITTNHFETVRLYDSYFFSVAGFFGLGLVVLSVLLAISLTGSVLERLHDASIGQIIFRYSLICVVIIGSLYLTNLFYKPIVFLHKEQLCIGVYDPVLRLACSQETNTK